MVHPSNPPSPPSAADLPMSSKMGRRRQVRSVPRKKTMEEEEEEEKRMKREERWGGAEDAFLFSLSSFPIVSLPPPPSSFVFFFSAWMVTAPFLFLLRLSLFFSFSAIIPFCSSRD